MVKFDKQGVDQAVFLLRQGKSVVFPTDTAYGLAVDATNIEAVRKLYLIKGRSFNKPVHVIVNSLKQAKKLALFNSLAEKLFRKFLPGPLTLVLPLRPPFHLPLMRGRKRGGHRRKSEALSAIKLLSAGTGTLGVRMPKNRIALSLVRGLGRPITATSANISGQPACYLVAEVTAQFEKSRIKPDLILDSNKLPRVKPSTVVDLTGQSVKILRQGPISKKQIFQTCAEKR